jgi:hypothetical protein
LNIPLGEIFRNDMGNMYAKFYEFIMHIKGDIDLSLFSFSEICRLKEQELRRTSYMKDVALYERLASMVERQRLRMMGNEAVLLAPVGVDLARVGGELREARRRLLVGGGTHGAQRGTTKERRSVP